MSRSGLNANGAERHQEIRVLVPALGESPPSPGVDAIGARHERTVRIEEGDPLPGYEAWPVGDVVDCVESLAELPGLVRRAHLVATVDLLNALEIVFG